MMFQLKKPTRSEAVLVLGQVKYEGGEDLLEYRVQNISSHSDFACGECYFYLCTIYYQCIYLLSMKVI